MRARERAMVLRCGECVFLRSAGSHQSPAVLFATWFNLNDEGVMSASEEHKGTEEGHAYYCKIWPRPSTSDLGIYVRMARVRAVFKIAPKSHACR